jgi:DNA-binding FrmR family transcriptional regulator
MNIRDIIKQITAKLNLDNKSITDKLSKEQLDQTIDNEEKINQINELLSIDERINSFGAKLTQPKTLENFKNLKDNLGELQVLILLKKLNEKQNCDEVLSVLLEILSAKFKTVNNILENDLKQTGGNSNYYNKYIEYKIKYLNLKNKF